MLFSECLPPYLSPFSSAMIEKAKREGPKTFELHRPIKNQTAFFLVSVVFNHSSRAGGDYFHPSLFFSPSFFSRRLPPNPSSPSSSSRKLWALFLLLPLQMLLFGEEEEGGSGRRRRRRPTRCQISCPPPPSTAVRTPPPPPFFQLMRQPKTDPPKSRDSTRKGCHILR